MMYIKEKLKIPIKVYRKFHFIFNDKQKNLIIDEMNYYKSIYKGVESNKLFECVVNKYLKMKLHNVVFHNIIKDVREYKKKIEEEYKDIINY